MKPHDLHAFRNSCAVFLLSAFSAGAPSLARAATGAYTLPSVTLPSAFGNIVTWMQNFVTFMTGPFGTAVVALSIVIAFAVWVFAPREGIVGPVARVVVAGFVLMNVATWMGLF